MPDELEGPTVTLIDVYVPAAMGVWSTMTVESVCKRVTSGDETVTGTFTLLPELGVRLMPVIGSTKSRTFVPTGGAS